ncbi:hypothetical protein RB195_017341 [Necator americanus]|uniref:Serpentine receptor class gamma n=1 Tax=Necator americanus TaxID=51031 RepID=A0ABR1C6R3_NECAM
MIIRIIYCIPSMVLYVLVLVALFKEVKASKGHFYYLLMTQAVLNIAVFLNSFYAVQLANVTEVKDWWSVMYTKAPTFIISIMWSYGFPAAIVITLFTPFFATYQFLVFKSWFEEDKESKHFILKTNANLYVVLTELLIFMCLFLVLTCSVNAISVFFLCCRRAKNRSRVERNMFLLALLDLLIEAAFFILFVCFSVFSL